MSDAQRHAPVLLAETMDALAPHDGGIYVDGTFGRGGHSRAILNRLGPQGRLVALDRDPQAAAAARELRDERFMFLKHNFGTLNAVSSSMTIAGGITLRTGSNTSGNIAFGSCTPAGGTFSGFSCP